MEVDIVIIGAGVIGLAIAREAVKLNKKVIIIEANDKIGGGASQRNSEVIHAGIYYPPKSLKADLCIRGKDLIYEYCKKNNVPFKKIGKIIVANQDEIKKLQKLEKNAKESGVFDLKFLERDEIKKLEPEVHAEYGLLSPSTGIFDLGKFMASLAYEVGDVILFNHKVLDVTTNGNYNITVSDGKDNKIITSQAIINAAGLFTPLLLKQLDCFPDDKIPEQFYCKGSYCLYNKPNVFQHLIYPMPEDGGLGIHSTVDMNGNIKFGPDTEWIDQMDYSFDDKKIDVFYDEVIKYYPNIDKSLLSPGYAGVRTKLSRNSFCDFLIQDESYHGVKNWINLLGIESPGITASLAIGEYTLKKLYG